MQKSAVIHTFTPIRVKAVRDLPATKVSCSLEKEREKGFCERSVSQCLQSYVLTSGCLEILAVSKTSNSHFPSQQIGRDLSGPPGWPGRLLRFQPYDYQQGKIYYMSIQQRLE